MIKNLMLAGALAASFAGAVTADGAVAPADAADDAVTSESDVYVYPSKGQTEKQLDRDRYECHNWAVAQSHYNPSDTHLAPHQQIQVVAVPAPPPPHATIVGAMAGAMIGA